MKLNKTKIRDMGRVATGKTPPTKNRNYFDGEYLFVTPTDLEYKHFYCRQTETTVTEEAKNKFRNQFIPQNSIMFTCIGNTIGKCALSSSECLTNQQINTVIPNEDHDFRFVYYLLNNNINYIKGLGAGAATPIVNKTKFESIEFRVPELSDQERIGKFLYLYDELIENNRRRIELLEESARLLYREWFVHLRFPGHEHTKITKGVPEGWEKVTVSDLCESKQGFAFKGKDFLDDETDLTLVRMGNFKIGGGLQFVDNTKYLPEGYGFNEKFKLQADDLVMVLSDVTRDGRIIGNVGFIPNDGKTYILNQRIAKIECDNEIRIFLYCHFNSQIFKDFCLGYATSATVLNLSNQNLYKHALLKPDKKILSVFNGFIEPIIRQIDSLTLTNAKLKQARDILLPRLMNGDIAV